MKLPKNTKTMHFQVNLFGNLFYQILMLFELI